jgi:cell wall-associated NlpC family hydrolase
MLGNQLVVYDYAKALVGIPYIYGGSSPLVGFDCSGLVLELLMAVGLWKPGTDATAQGIFNHFTALGRVATSSADLGALAFYGKSIAAITHVGLCLNDQLMIEAGGGDSTTVNREAAVRRGACVRIRPIKARRDLVAVVVP